MLDNRPLYVLAFIPDLFVGVGVIVAFIFAIAKRRQLGAAAGTLAATGLAILGLNLILGVLWNLFAFRLVIRQLDNIMTVVSVYSIASKVFWAIGMGLILGAIFVRRPAPQPPLSS